MAQARRKAAVSPSAITPFALGAEQSRTRLCKALGISAATLKQWHRLEVVPRPDFHGPGTRYPRALAARVVAARVLRKQGLTMDELRARLSAMSDEQVDALLGAPWVTVTASQSMSRVLARPAPAAPAYPARGWHRVVLVPGLELWVDAEGPAALRQLAARVWEHFGQPAQG